MKDIARKNLIDGVPNSYDTNYVLKTKKKCIACNHRITIKDIENNKIVCMDTFDFFHKKCLEKKRIQYKHYNNKDKSTPAELIEQEEE